MHSLASFHALDKAEARQAVRQCCGATKWVDQMMAHFPFENENSLLQKAESIWYDHSDSADYLEAFSHHPKIGDVGALAEKFPETGNWAAGEQSAVQQARQEILQELADLNEQYFQQFGYIFIVCATGKSAEEMLQLLKVRLRHNKEEELGVAMGEQFKITLIRLNKLLDLSGSTLPNNSQITTHVLDTAIGKPGQQICIKLKHKVQNQWQSMALGFTNSDGRIPDLLPAGKILKPGPYQMHFDTQRYFDQQKVTTFYPEVAIHFSIFDDSHYHVPLLVNPFGYSTYRGS